MVKMTHFMKNVSNVDTYLSLYVITSVLEIVYGDMRY